MNPGAGYKNPGNSQLVSLKDCPMPEWEWIGKEWIIGYKLKIYGHVDDDEQLENETQEIEFLLISGLL